jgi:hypothetical protein
MRQRFIQRGALRHRRSTSIANPNVPRLGGQLRQLARGLAVACGEGEDRIARAKRLRRQVWSLRIAEFFSAATLAPVAVLEDRCELKLSMRAPMRRFAP